MVSFLFSERAGGRDAAARMDESTDFHDVALAGEPGARFDRRKNYGFHAAVPGF
jgi:hypothetical protein